MNDGTPLTLEQEAALLVLRDREHKRCPHPARLEGSPDREVQALRRDGLIERTLGGFVLTDAGRQALCTGRFRPVQARWRITDVGRAQLSETLLQ